MLPESIRAEIEAKGGLSGPPEPQGNGTTIYRAVSGDYVVVDDASGQARMRGFSAPADPTATPQAPAQPAAPAPAAPAGAGGMNQQQLEALLQQIAPNGDPRRLVFSEGVKKKTAPADAFGAGREIQTRWVKWVDPGTGRVLEADIEEDGSYTVTKNAIERGEQGPAASSGQGAGPQEGDTRGPQTGPTREVFEGGKWVVRPNPVYQAPEPPKPGAPTLKPDGKGGTIAVQTMPDGTIKTTPLPGVPSEASSKYTQVKQDPATGKWSGLTAAGAWEEIKGGPGLATDAFGVEPAGAPDVPMQVGQITNGLRQYSSWLSGQVKLHKDTNGAQGVAPAEATKLMERRIALAESAIKEQSDIVNTQSTQRSQDITQRGQTLGETQNRRGVAERTLQNVQANTLPLLKYLNPGDAQTFVAAQQEMLQNALGYAGQWGGLRESPEIAADSFPALQQVREQSLAGIQTAAAGGPRIFDARTPPTAPPDPTAAAATMANPVFRPQPPATPPVASAPAPASAPIVPPAANPIDGSPVALPTQLPGSGGPPVRDDYRTDTPQVAPVAPQVAAPPAPYTPDQLQPGVPVQVPGAPPGQSVPYPSDASLQSKTMPARFMQETRYGPGNFFDPDLAGNELSMRLGIAPEIMRQAISGLYG